jgi:hypothetical protein
MKRVILCIIALPTFASAEANIRQGMQTINIPQELMPQLIAFLQAQGQLPAAKPQSSNDQEQAKFCNIVGACVSGFASTIISGNPAPVISAIVSSIVPLISRNHTEQRALEEFAVTQGAQPLTTVTVPPQEQYQLLPPVHV